jgi:predicted negative regulator of RcsB-dependent stress response
VARLSRKELKKDEIRETLAHSAEAISSHQKLVYSIVIPALIIAIGFLGWKYYQRTQDAKASAALSGAMLAYNGTVKSLGQPPIPGMPAYANQKIKFEDASKELLAVADRYPRTPAGEMARYYSAVCLAWLGRTPEAEKQLGQLQSARGRGIADLARFELAQLYDRTGKGNLATPIYQQLLAKPSPFVPKPLVLLAFGDHYSKADPKRAAKLYEEVKSEFSGTGLAEQADKRLQMLVLAGKT